MRCQKAEKEQGEENKLETTQFNFIPGKRNMVEIIK